MNNSEQLDLLENTESSQEDSLAKTSAWLDDAKAWLEQGADSSGRSADSSTKPSRATSSSKTSLVCFRLNKDGTWEQSQPRFHLAGIAWHGELLMLNTSEFPSDAVESSLSDVLETTGEHLQKYSLSQKAAEGILRRATRRGKTLPAPLQAALEAVASSDQSKSAH